MGHRCQRDQNNTREQCSHENLEFFKCDDAAADVTVGSSHPCRILTTAATMLIGEANSLIDLHNRLFDQLRGRFLVAALVRGRLTQ